jgi:hypothetical protein
MSIFKFTNPLNGQPFELKGPATLTEAQARDIFQKQIDAGSLVGFKSGDALSAATQAADGLQSALSQVSQAAAGIGGSAQGALQGALKNLPSPGQLSAAASGIATGIQTALQSASSLPGGLTGALDTAKSVAQTTMGGIANAIAKTPVASGINVADFAKQATALVPIGKLSVPDVTATLGQVGKLVNQTAGQITNSLGVGKFGLDASQLETAGLLKPGTAANFLSTGVNKLTDVLKSPTVWTGKDGISSLTGLLESLPTQDAVQQKLMAVGKDAVSNLGIPTDKLNPQALAGTLANAAKSVPDTMKWAQGLPLPTGVKTAFDQTASASAFAVGVAQTKIPEPFKEEVTPPVAEGTVNRDTLNAAATRITGNAKIPAVSYDSKPPKISLDQWSTDTLKTTGKAFSLLKSTIEINKGLGKATEKVELIAFKDQLEYIKGEVTLVESDLIKYENQGKQIARDLGSNPLQSNIDSAKDTLKTVLKVIDKILAAIQAELDKATA